MKEVQIPILKRGRNLMRDKKQCSDGGKLCSLFKVPGKGSNRVKYKIKEVLKSPNEHLGVSSSYSTYLSA